MPKTKIFIGSSTAARSQAKRVIAELESSTIRFLPWWDAFTPGRTLLEELDNIKNKVDGALLLFSPESKTIIRGKEYIIPNLNVLFEFGYFYGHFERQKVAILRYGKYYLPSDLGGYINIFGSDGFTRASGRKINVRTKKEFDRWIEQL